MVIIFSVRSAVGKRRVCNISFLAALLHYLCGVQSCRGSVLQVSTAFAAEGREHLEQFTGLLYCGKVFRMCFTSIWFASVWSLWKARNMYIV